MNKATNPLIENYELIKEVHYVFENIDPKIIGRIYKIILGANAKYTWDINYYNRLADEGGVYIPSGPYAHSLGEIEIKLNQYVMRFEDAVVWTKNEFF